MSVDLGEQIDYTTSTELVSSDLVGADRTSIVDSRRRSPTAIAASCTSGTTTRPDTATRSSGSCRRSPGSRTPRALNLRGRPKALTSGSRTRPTIPDRSVNRPALCPLAGSARSGQAWSLTTILSMPTTATDTELVRQYLAGDQRPGDIYERYGDRAYDLCFAMLRSGDDAADAYQDTFLTAANKLDQLRDTERLRSWLYSVARNQCRARLSAETLDSVDDAGVDIGTEVDMTADLGRDELRALLTEASAGLNERERGSPRPPHASRTRGRGARRRAGVSVQNATNSQRVRDGWNVRSVRS